MKIPTLKPTIDYKDQLLTLTQIECLISRKEIMSKTPTEIQQACKICDITWEEAEQVYYSFDTPTRAMIRKSGQQLQQGYYNPSKGDLDAPGTQPTDARGILITKMWIEQGFKCAYTSDGPRSILDFQVEHIIPGEGDYPSNIVLVLANVNENKKSSTMEYFIERNIKRYERGEYETWYKSMKEAAAKNQKVKVEILDMDDEELRAYITGTPNKKYDKYLWRNIGMSSLSGFRIKKSTGEKRAGGSQGNYKEVLNTILLEYLFGDQDLAREIYNSAKLFRSKYLEGQIQSDVYAHLTADVIELSNHVVSGYNRDKFISKVIRNNYSWPHLN
jgi:hypothetical protein